MEVYRRTSKNILITQNNISKSKELTLTLKKQRGIMGNKPGVYYECDASYEDDTYMITAFTN